MCLVLFLRCKGKVFYGQELLSGESTQRHWYIEVGEACLCGHLCCFVATMHLFSQSLSIVLRCGGLLLNIIFRFSIARCIRWPGIVLITVSCRCVIDVMVLHCICCIWLIWTRIIVYSVTFHLLLLEFGIPELRAAASIEVKSIKVKS